VHGKAVHSSAKRRLRVADSVLDCIGQTPIVRLSRLFDSTESEVLAKLEFLNPGGSVKDRPARFIVEAGLATGAISRETHLVESSSGNFGIALAMVACVHGLQFTCVVDPHTCAANLQILRELGADTHIAHTPDENGGFLGARIARVKQLLHEFPNSYWINQYANELNAQAHAEGTAQEILDATDGDFEVFVAAVSTTGTVTGVARRLREVTPGIRVVAVDAVGSVIFGGTPGERRLPGMGASRVPELADPRLVDEVIYVDEASAIEACRSLARAEGIFAGASSGAVVEAVRRLVLSEPPQRVVTLLSDRGERYLDSVYSNAFEASPTREAGSTVTRSD